MEPVVANSRIHATKCSFETKCARAHKSDCVFELTTVLGSIATDKGREDEKQAVYQAVLERKVDVGPVALQCLYHLSLLGSEAHRRAVNTILAQGYNQDTDQIYAGAIASLVKLPDMSAADLQTVAGALFASSSELRASTRSLLRSLDSRVLRDMIDLNADNVAQGKPFSKAFSDAVEQISVEVEVFESTELPDVLGRRRRI